MIAIQHYFLWVMCTNAIQSDLARTRNVRQGWCDQCWDIHLSNDQLALPPTPFCLSFRWLSKMFPPWCCWWGLSKSDCNGTLHETFTDTEKYGGPWWPSDIPEVDADWKKLHHMGKTWRCIGICAHLWGHCPLTTPAIVQHLLRRKARLLGMDVVWSPRLWKVKFEMLEFEPILGRPSIWCLLRWWRQISRLPRRHS